MRLLLSTHARWRCVSGRPACLETPDLRRSRGLGGKRRVAVNGGRKGDRPRRGPASHRPADKTLSELDTFYICNIFHRIEK
ncbi:unnamed protein product [Caretta caretta]